jgi:serine protease AprX
VVSLAAPGSTVYNGYPGARIGPANFVGSGTSFSAAITSGAAALVLAANRGLAPDQVKARLLGTTSPGPVGNPFVDGHGALNALAAATAGPMDFSQSAAGLQPAKKGAMVSLAPTSPVDTWNTALWSGITAAPQASWSFDGSTWSGSDWNGWALEGRAWNEGGWNNGGWNGAAWDGSAWSGSAWDGTGWSGSAWQGSAWSGSAWSGSAWS